MNKLIIANWKMQLTHAEAITWLANHVADAEKNLALTRNKLVICPSFTELAYTSKLHTTNIRWGAQDCGFEERGAYTGDVSSLSLKELGCSFALVGHSERRKYYCESPLLVAQKAELLMKHTIEPVVCIGETMAEHDEGMTFAVLEKQLTPVVELMKKNNRSKVTIAYEPIWSIGTQNIPRAHEISAIIEWVRHFVNKHLNHVSLTVLYGGSVNERTIKDLGLNLADGFLLGKASIEYDSLKQIILAC